MAEEQSRSGFVSIVGRTNSGKSTLLNRLVGEKVSIVTNTPQTTRNVIRGIVTRPEGQAVFLDTPGVHRPIHRMNERMMEASRRTLGEVDLLALIADASASFGRGDEFTLDLIRPVTIPKFLLLNKIDMIRKPDLLPKIDRYAKLANFDEVIPISALTGENVETFLAEVFKRLPVGPQFYPEDQLSDQPERMIAAEIVREKLIEATYQELPHATAVIIEQFEEKPEINRIFASVLVERESQKAIAIGKGGSLMKAAGTAARLELEKLFGKQVYLELRVKVRKDWRNDDGMLTRLGFE